MHLPILALTRPGHSSRKKGGLNLLFERRVRITFPGSLGDSSRKGERPNLLLFERKGRGTDTDTDTETKKSKRAGNDPTKKNKAKPCQNKVKNNIRRSYAKIKRRADRSREQILGCR